MYGHDFLEFSASFFPTCPDTLWMDIKNRLYAYVRSWYNVTVDVWIINMTCNIEMRVSEKKKNNLKNYGRNVRFLLKRKVGGRYLPKIKKGGNVFSNLYSQLLVEWTFNFFQLKMSRKHVGIQWQLLKIYNILKMTVWFYLCNWLSI